MNDTDPYNCSERVLIAIQTLVSGRNIRQRLREVWLILHPLQKNEFPEDLQSEFQEIMDSIKPKGGSTPSVSDPMYRMKTTKAEDLAKRIVSLLYGLLAPI